jgi:hypothetical protein
MRSIIRKEGESWRDCAIRYARNRGLDPREAAQRIDAAIARGEDEASAAFEFCEEHGLTEELRTPLDMPEND